ncbi:DUF4132 domain-containing protein [Saccharibacillus sp. JS10]|uniref:DUF4132 domain-containing protein n=1 Tax=Saccharibacillus sp. JS10 TaxID=2950552 RepID=UPI00210B5F51|nr:DUF4132 domain-containing protein [Saccharibacillus sp. JS10]MCQ4087389.1 DUF4132 domain-containing protein [Saccharibacillus sp. JS10]
MTLQNQTLEMLIERFAKACSDDYSLAVDRKDSIIDYVNGTTDRFPDMMSSSNHYLYRTIEALEKLGRSDQGEIFFRAASVLLRTKSKNGYGYQENALYRACTGDLLAGINLGTKQMNDIEKRMEQSLERLQLMQKYAGAEQVHAFFRSRISSMRKGSDSAPLETSADTLVLLKLYAQIDAEFVQEMKEKLPHSIQALLEEDADRMRKYLLKAIEPLVIRQLPLKDTLTQLDLTPEFVEARRSTLKARLFPNSELDPNEQLRREQQNAVLTQLRIAFYYVLLLHGGKESLLASSSELDITVLDLVRDVHEILPLEMRNELLMMENTGKDPDAVLQGVVRVDEPFALISTLAREIDSYMPAWNMLRTELTKDIKRTQHLFSILRRPMLRAYVYRVLSDQGTAPQIEGGIEQFVLDTLADKLHGNILGHSLAKYLTGEVSLETYVKHKPSHAWDETQGNDTRRRNLLIAVTFLPKESEMYARFVKIAGQKEVVTPAFLSYLYQSPTFSGEALLSKVEADPDADGDMLLLQILLLNGYNRYYYARISETEIRNVVRPRLQASLDLYNELQGEVRQVILETALSTENEEELIQALRLGLGDSSKRSREMARAELIRRPYKELYIRLYLSDKKASVREVVIDLLRGIEGEGDAYNQLIQKEKSVPLKARLQALSDTLGKPAEYAHAALAAHADPKKLSRLSGFSVDLLPELLSKDGHKLDDAIKSYILTESIDFTTEPNPRLDEVAEYADASSLAAFTTEALNMWINAQAPAKEKWILPLAARFGGRDVIDLLGRQIKDWADNSRGAIAADAVRALAYMDDTSALMTIDRLGRSIKNRQVKGAAEEALQLAAANQGLTKEQLADKLITTLGFDEKGELNLSYGERSFTIKVSADLQLTAINEENGKVVKSLPAPGQKDDSELAAASKSRFTQLKKDLKVMVGIQSQRLEESLSKRRLWSTSEWTELFVRNIVMRQFAVGLIWGVYAGSGEETAIDTTFRYMEDGTFNTVDEDEYELPEDAQIGLVHPLELDADTLAAWKTQLKDYEIVQPFVQLDRPVYAPEEDDQDRRTYSRLPQGDYSPTAFPKALEKYGWVKGRAQDGGFYTELFKPYGDLIALLNFSGTSISYYEGMDDVTLEELQFFDNKGDGYYYTSMTGHLIKNVPSRVFSETVYDILRATGQ